MVICSFEVEADGPADWLSAPSNRRAPFPRRAMNPHQTGNPFTFTK